MQSTTSFPSDIQAVSPSDPSASALDASFRVLYRFRGHLDGGRPYSDLIETRGALYGTTSEGGSGNRQCFCGTVFSFDASGGENVLHRFSGGSDGAYPQGGVVFLQGSLYGTTSAGGGGACRGAGYASGCGTVFVIDGSGQERIVHRFAGGSDGAFPSGSLVVLNGMIYGVTSSGGFSGCGCGTVFAVDASGNGGPIYSFRGNRDGSLPMAGLTLIAGKLYGTTSDDGLCGQGHCGSLFTVSPAGALRVIHKFDGSDGAYPLSNPVSLNGSLYGTTNQGGNGCVLSGCGTIYAIEKGKERTVWLFGGNKDGSGPAGRLAIVNGKIYGTTQSGGLANCDRNLGCGTIFEFDPTTNRETKSHEFEESQGAYPYGVLARGRKLYGAAELGGQRTLGTVFSLAL